MLNKIWNASIVALEQGDFKKSLKLMVLENELFKKQVLKNLMKVKYVVGEYDRRQRKL